MFADVRSVLITEQLDDVCTAILTRNGISVTKQYNLTEHQLVRELKKHDAVIIRSETIISGETIKALPNLRLIGRAGFYVSNIDLEVATQNGVVVLHTPGSEYKSVCELTCGLIIAVTRRIVQASQLIKEGRWDSKPGRELAGKILGIIGFDRDGQEVAHRMKSFGMDIVAYDPYLHEDKAKQLNIIKMDLEDIWKHADYISIHLPLTPATKNLINERTLSMCKGGVYIISVTCRGVIDEEALYRALSSGRCAGAALDIEERSISYHTRKLIHHKNVICSPNLRTNTEEAELRVATDIAEQIVLVVGKSTKFVPMGIVNAPALAAAINADSTVWVDLGKRLGVMAGKFVDRDPNKMKIRACVPGITEASKKLVFAAIYVGLMSRRVERDLSLINAPSHAESLGITIEEFKDDRKDNMIILHVGTHTLEGTIGKGSAILLRIDNVNLGKGVILAHCVSIYQSNKYDDLTAVIKTHMAHGVPMKKIEVVDNLIILQTDNPDPVLVSGVKSYYNM